MIAKVSIEVKENEGEWRKGSMEIDGNEVET